MVHSYYFAGPGIECRDSNDDTHNGTNGMQVRSHQWPLLTDGRWFVDTCGSCRNHCWCW